MQLRSFVVYFAQQRQQDLVHSVGRTPGWARTLDVALQPHQRLAVSAVFCSAAAAQPHGSLCLLPGPHSGHLALSKSYSTPLPFQSLLVLHMVPMEVALGSVV